MASLSTASRQNLIVPLGELLDLFILVCAGFDGANIGEGLLGDIAHEAFLGRNAPLYATHPLFEKVCKDAQGQNATESYAGQNR